MALSPHWGLTHFGGGRDMAHVFGEMVARPVSVVPERPHGQRLNGAKNHFAFPQTVCEYSPALMNCHGQRGVMEGRITYAPTADEEPLTLPSPSKGEGMEGLIGIQTVRREARNPDAGLIPPGMTWGGGRDDPGRHHR
jgi:hypothetical protein